MLKIYGSMMCPDCVACREAFDNAGVTYEYYDFADDLRNLKAFLSIRDADAAFEGIKAEGKIGIPCILREDGTITFDWMTYVGQADA
jgi:glutaredoxin-related protein